MLRLLKRAALLLLIVVATGAAAFYALFLLLRRTPFRPLRPMHAPSPLSPSFLAFPLAGWRAEKRSAVFPSA